MNKNLLKRIASVATELDQFGFTREAKSLDLILLKLAQEEMEGFEMDDSGPEKDEKPENYFDEDEFDEADMFPFMGESGYPDGSEYGNQEYPEDIDYF